MSKNKNKMPLAIAKPTAERIVAFLEPHCSQIAIAGSIRRNKSEVSDIEIVCVVKYKERSDEGFFIDEFSLACASLGKFIKGRPVGKYLRIMLNYYNIALDLFMTTPEQWGYIYLLRTGSADFSKTMVKRLKDMGYYMQGGQLYRSNLSPDQAPIPVPDEQTLFKLAKMDYVEPEKREG